MSAQMKKILSVEESKAIERVERTREETTQNLRDEIHRESALLQPDGDADVTRSDVQAGRKLPRSLIIERLKKLNPAIRYAQSINYPELGGIYIADGSMYVIPTESVPGRHLVGIPHGMVNEFDVRHAKDGSIPDPTIAHHWQQVKRVSGRDRGWRGIILKLVDEGVINLERAERVFHITAGRSSKNWQQAVN